MAVADSIGGLQQARQNYDFANLQTLTRNVVADADARRLRDDQARAYWLDMSGMGERARDDQRRDAVFTEQAGLNRDYFKLQKQTTESEGKRDADLLTRDAQDALKELETQLAGAASVGRVPNETALMAMGGDRLPEDARARLRNYLGAFQASQAGDHDKKAADRALALTDQFQNSPDFAVNLTPEGRGQALAKFVSGLKPADASLVLPDYKTGVFTPRAYAGARDAIRYFSGESEPSAPPQVARAPQGFSPAAPPAAPSQPPAEPPGRRYFFAPVIPGMPPLPIPIPFGGGRSAPPAPPAGRSDGRMIYSLDGQEVWMTPEEAAREAAANREVRRYYPLPGEAGPGTQPPPQPMRRYWPLRFYPPPPRTPPGPGMAPAPIVDPSEGRAGWPIMSDL